MNLHQYAETHQVTNQPPSLDGVNLYRIDLPLQHWSQHVGAGWAQGRIDQYGALAGGPLMAAGFLANENKPVFVSHDRFGHRAEVLFADFFMQQAERGLLIEESNRIYLTTRGLFLADLVFRDLIGWLKERPQIMKKED